MVDTAQLNDALAANYMLVDLEIRSWSGNKIDREASSEVIASKGATKDSGRFVKALLAGADNELAEVKRLASVVRAFVYNKTLPWSGNSEGAKRGARLLAATSSFEFLRELNEIKREYDFAVQALVAVWDQRCIQARTNLGGLAAADDYPDSNALSQLFGVKVDLKPVPTMADFSRINVPTALAEALGQRHAVQAEAQLVNAMDDLKERLLKELARIATQLGKAGRKEETRLYDSLVTNMQTLVGLVRTMNVAGNASLTALADKIESQLLSRPVTAYKNTPELAAEVAAQAQNLAVEAAMENVWKV